MAAITSKKPTLEEYTSEITKAKILQTSVEKALIAVQKGTTSLVDPALFSNYNALIKVIKTNGQILQERVKQGEKINPKILQAHRDLTKTANDLSGKIKVVYAAVHPQAQPTDPAAPKLRKGETPLHWAVRNHDHDLARKLCMAGHSPHAPDADNLTPIDEAVLQSDPTMRNILLFTNILANPTVKAEFEKNIQNAQKNLAALMNTIDLEHLSPVNQAAFNGTVEELSELATPLELTTPDARGLTPLHYAILGKNFAVIQYLIPRSKIHYLTPKGNSYLDYAILSGDSSLHRFFTNAGSVFRLGKPEQLVWHLLCTGILYQDLQKTAAQKDPIRINPLDAALAESNITQACWSALIYVTELLGANPGMNTSHTDWLPRINQLVHNGSSGFFELQSLNKTSNGLERLIQLKWLPQFSKYIIQAYQLSRFANSMIQLVGLGFGYQIPMIIPTPIAAANSYSPGSGDMVWKTFSAARMAGITASVLPKIGAYWNTFKSRPKAVITSCALDLLNFSSEAYSTYLAFATPRPANS